MDMDEYEEVEHLCHLGGFEFFRVVEIASGEKFLVRKTVQGYPYSQNNLHKEYQELQQARLTNVASPIAVANQALVFQDLPGKSLRSYLKNKALSTFDILSITIQLLETIIQSHQKNKTQIPIIPDHILMTNDNQFQILPFPPTADVYQLKYQSPESFIQPKFPGDERSDLYVFGVLMYEMFTGGKHPFPVNSHIDWKHNHLAVAPIRLNRMNRKIPKKISKIVMALLEKDPTKRYQSTLHLQEDLMTCRDKLLTDGKIKPFPLSLQSQKGNYEISSQFYGKEKELEKLYHLFQQVQLGSSNLVSVSGPAGVGKTTFVNKRFKPWIETQAYFISGKFDQLQTNIPYEPLIEAFRQMIRQILTQPDEEVAAWKKQILAAIEPNGQIITDVIPELTAVIGEQPVMETVRLHQAENRFDQVFRQFVQVFTNIDYPLVLFLDDIQWADRSTLKLIHSLFTDSNNQRLFVIVSYRPNQDDLYEKLNTIPSNTHIPLSLLSITEVEQFVADTLSSSILKSRGLAQLIYRKTGGNPFYIKQLLQVIYANQWLYFDTESDRWRWDAEAIDAVQDQAQIIDYMEQKIRQLPKPVMEMLKLASCLGNSFYKQDLRHFLQVSSEHMEDTLTVAEQEGIILPPDTANGHKRYYFFHDKLQQMIYSFTSEEQKQRLHLEIGRFLKTIDETDNVLFKMVEHYTKGIHAIDDLAEIQQVMRLNFRAGEKAKRATAYDTALHYYRIAHNLLTKQECEHDPAFCFQLRLDLARVENKCGNYQSAETIYNQLLSTAGNWSEQALVYSEMMIQCVHQGKYNEAIVIGLNCLEQVGISIPTNPSPTAVKKELDWTYNYVRANQDQLRDLPDVSDIEIHLIMDIIFQLIVPSFFTNKQVFTQIICASMQLTIKHGQTTVTPAVLGAYGVLLCTELDQYEASYDIGKVAVNLADQSYLPSIQCRTYVMFGGIICQWHSDRVQGELYLKKAVELGMQVGDYIYTSMAIGCHINLIYPLEKLETIEQINSDYITTLEQMKDEFVLQNTVTYIQFSRSLRGLTDGPTSFNDANFNEQQFLERIEQEDSKGITLFQYYTYKTQLHFLYGDYQQAVACANKVEAYLPYVKHLAHLDEYLFYRSLAILKGWQQWSEQDRSKYLPQLDEARKRFASLRVFNQERFEHKEWILQAEYANVFGGYQHIEGMYVKANMATKLNRNKAILLELAGCYFHQSGQERIAKIHLQEARAAYNDWGAEAKAKQIEQSFPDYFERKPRAQLPDDKVTQAKDEKSANDLNTIMKTTAVLSDEIDAEKSLQELMLTIAQEPLAEKAILFTKESDELMVTAMVEQASKFSLHHQPIDQEKNIPHSIVRYVTRTRETVLEKNISLLREFESDAYIRAYLPKSVLCLPLFLQGKLSGIIYLENRFLANLFYQKQVDIIKYLGTQAMFVTKLMDTTDTNEAPPKTSNEVIYDELTEREREIINLMAAGHSNQEIARALGLKLGTVKVHNHNIFSKLGVKRRTKAIIKAKELNLLEE